MGFVIQYGFCHASASLTLGERCLGIKILTISQSQGLILITTVTTGGGVLFQVSVLFSIDKACFCLLFCREFTYFWVHFFTGQNSAAVCQN